MSGRDPVSFHGWVTHAFEESITVDTEDGPVVLPRSQLLRGTEVDDEGDEGRVVVPRWLAEDRGVEHDEEDDEP